MPLLYDFDMDSAAELANGLAQRTQQRRLEKGLSRDALSMMSGIPTPTIAKFEQQGTISLVSFLALAKALGFADEIRIAAKSKITSLRVGEFTFRRSQLAIKLC